MEMQLDYNFELSPPRLSEFIRRLRQYSVWVGIALMKFKVNLLDVRRHVFVGVRLHVDGPLVGMAVLLAFLAEVTGHVAVDYRLYYSQTLEV